MNAIEQIRKEIEDKEGYRWATDDQAVLSPLFWQAVGKARRWNNPSANNGIHYWSYERRGDKITLLDDHENAMHDFVQWIIEGKDANSFFQSL